MFEQIFVAIIASCIASLAIYYFTSSGLFAYSLDVLERVLSGKEFSLYDCIGGIIVPIGDPSGQCTDMNDVPNGLYQRALKMALVQMAAGKSPTFDLRVIGEWEVYWIHAGRENEVHVLSFFRRPRLFVRSRQR